MDHKSEPKLYSVGHVQLSMHGKLQWENPVTCVMPSLMHSRKNQRKNPPYSTIQLISSSSPSPRCGYTRCGTRLITTALIDCWYENCLQFNYGLNTTGRLSTLTVYVQEAMATSKGGFGCEFITVPPRSLECPICLLQLGRWLHKFRSQYFQHRS